MTTICLNKKLDVPEALPAWMYKNPETIIEKLLKTNTSLRNNKQRRIAALTKNSIKNAGVDHGTKSHT